MPSKPLRPCVEPGCGAVVKSGACPQHQMRTGSTYGRQYRKQRQGVLKIAQVCAICGNPPTADDPFETDHIVPIVRGGIDKSDNLRATHRSCNRSRTRDERRG